MNQSSPSKIPSSFRDTGFVIVLIYLVCIVFNSESIHNWLREKIANHPSMITLYNSFKPLHQQLDQMTFTSARKKLRRAFLTTVPLGDNLDEIGFASESNAKVPVTTAPKPQFKPLPLMNPIQLFASGPVLTKMNLGIEATAAWRSEDPHLAGPQNTESLALNIETAPEAATHDSPAGFPKVLVIGDSVMGGIAPMIKRVLRQKGEKNSPIINWKVSSGLARSDYYDWPKVVSHLLSDHSVDVVVALFGTNDAQNAIWEAGKFIPNSKGIWLDVYRRKVKEMQTLLCQRTKRVYWLELPAMKKGTFERKVQNLNKIFKEEAAHQPCIEFLATRTVLGGEGGGYTTYRQVAEKRTKIRHGDGIHLTMQGGDLMARYIINKITFDYPTLLTH